MFAGVFTCFANVLVCVDIYIQLGILCVAQLSIIKINGTASKCIPIWDISGHQFCTFNRKQLVIDCGGLHVHITINTPVIVY